MKENTILSGNCKFLDQRARETSGEKVKKEKKKKVWLPEQSIPGGLGGPLKDTQWTTMTRPILLEPSLTPAKTDKRQLLRQDT